MDPTASVTLSCQASVVNCQSIRASSTYYPGCKSGKNRRVVNASVAAHHQARCLVSFAELARANAPTVMVRAAKRSFDEVVLRQFSDLHADLQAYLEETTSRLIRYAVEADTGDIVEVSEPQALT